MSKNVFRIKSKKRLKHIPPEFRGAHDYCFFLHDQCVQIMKEYEAAQVHVVKVDFLDSVERSTFERITKETNALEALRQINRFDTAKRIVLNRATITLVSDCLHHVFEALKCMEKRKSIVALNLLRKPLKDNFLYLAWMLGDEEAFFSAFTSGDAGNMDAKLLGNKRREIFSAGLNSTQLPDTVVDVDFLMRLLFDRKSDGLEKLFQHAVHLVTLKYEELKTEPQSFNLIFSDPMNDYLYYKLYDFLPYILLSLTHVIIALYDKIYSIEKGAYLAFQLRSICAYALLGGASPIEIRKDLGAIIPSDLACVHCGKLLSSTTRNMLSIVLSDSFYCSKCGRKSIYPFSWLI